MYLRNTYCQFVSLTLLLIPPLFSPNKDGYCYCFLFSFRKEMKLVRWKTAILATFASLVYSSQVMATFISLITLSATGKQLDTYTTFVTLALIGTIRATVASNISQGMNTLADFIAALNRIQGALEMQNEVTHKYLHEAFAKSETNRKGYSLIQHAKTQSYEHYSNTGNYQPQDNAVLLQNVICSWAGSWDKLTLKSLSLSVHQGDLIFIVGPVGCGKTSLLHAILQEIPLLTGKITRQGRITWAGQKPWILSGTMRDNILFGEAFDQQRYQRTLEVCDLYKDLQRFPDGDMTRVGERGVVLSGGQRARVELARAVYSNADIYLLDDPLSAVDSKVGQHIFRECITGILSDKTRLMITHNLQVLKDATNIVIIKDGTIVDKGDFSAVLTSGLDVDAIDKCTGNIEGAPLSKHEKTAIEPGQRALDDEFVRLQMDNEDREIGSISWHLYWDYIQAGMSTFLVGAMALLFLLVQGEMKIRLKLPGFSLGWRDHMLVVLFRIVLGWNEWRQHVRRIY